MAEISENNIEMENIQGVANIDGNGNVLKHDAQQMAEKQQEIDELERQRTLDKQKQLEYLLKRAELYTHFIENSEKPKKRDTPKTIKRSSLQAAKENHVAKRRRRILDSSSEDEESDLVAENKENTNSNENVAPSEAVQKVTQFEGTPNYINGEMRDYQVRGLNWLITLYENGVNGILADEMGLGKTLQTISFMGFLKHYENINGPFLVIGPNSTVINWMREIKRFCPSMRPISVMGSAEEREDALNKIRKVRKKKWNVCVTSYDIAMRVKSVLRKVQWRLVVIDEAQRIKNENTKFSQIVRTFPSINRLLLTGTPLQNNLHELWSLLNYLLPDIFKNSGDFDTWFDSDDCLAGNDDIVQRLHTILKPFMLRRLKSEVEKSLLPKIEVKLMVGLTALQRDLYCKLLRKDLSSVINDRGNPSTQKLGMVLMALRKAANHPYLINGVEKPPYLDDINLVKCSGKMMVLDKLLEKLKSQGSRVVLFSQFTSLMDVFEDYLNWRGYKYCRLDGNTKFDERAEYIDSYNAKNSDIFIFLLSTRAGGLGINLTTADAVIIFDSDWNPQSDLQAVDRVHRIGQTKQVRVFRLVTENTVDERIVQRAEIKSRLDRMVIQNRGKKPTENSAHSTMDMIRFGAEHILSDQCAEIIDVDIDKILAAGELRSADDKAKLDSLDKSELSKLTLEEASSVSIYQFDGVDFRTVLNKNKEDDVLPERRARKNVNYSKMGAGDSYENDKNWDISEYEEYISSPVNIVGKPSTSKQVHTGNTMMHKQGMSTVPQPWKPKWTIGLGNSANHTQTSGALKSPFMKYVPKNLPPLPQFNFDIEHKKSQTVGLLQKLDNAYNQINSSKIQTSTLHSDVCEALKVSGLDDYDIL